MSDATNPSYAFVLEYVSDIATTKRFFVDVMGLELVREAPVFVQFRDRNGAGFAIASDESLGGSGEREIYWVVEDADGAFRELSAQSKVTVPLEQKPFGKVFGVADPSGQPHYFVEFATVRPSNAAD